MPGFPADDDPLAAEIGELLVARDARLAIAETTAGGLISARLLSVPGASRWFDRGFVAYSGPAKLESLQMDREVLREHGAVSPRAVAAMAEAACKVSGVAYAIAESGIAGPQTSRRSPKPVGSVVIAVATPAGSVAEEHTFPGSRAEIMGHIAQRALELLAEALRSSASPP
ncbi:MAG: CinA family protein [Dehalococcoidia bacterium]